MKLPPIGFGCSPFRPEGRRVDLTAAVRAALAAGYRLFDLAELYGNERAVGGELRGAQAPRRRELFLTGKVWRTNFRPEALREACESSLQRLGVDAFDLYLLHAPEAWRHVAPLRDPEELGWGEFERRAVPRGARGEPEIDEVPLEASWEAMWELARRGLTERIGVSNFEPAQLQALGPELPAANQIARSPYQPNGGTAGCCRVLGIRLMIHSPLSAPGLLAEPLLVELAGRHRCAPAQIVLRWHVQRGAVPLPSSTDPDHILANRRAVSLELTADEMAAVDSLAVGR